MDFLIGRNGNKTHVFSCGAFGEVGRLGNEAPQHRALAITHVGNMLRGDTGAARTRLVEVGEHVQCAQAGLGVHVAAVVVRVGAPHLAALQVDQRAPDVDDVRLAFEAAREAPARQQAAQTGPLQPLGRLDDVVDGGGRGDAGGGKQVVAVGQHVRIAVKRHTPVLSGITRVLRQGS